jgi:uncharacterized protein (TIGR03435 family)
MQNVWKACLMVAFGCAVRAQTPAFEVMSVKPAAPSSGVGSKMSGGPGTNNPGRVEWLNVPLILTLMEAYDVYAYQISGPAWIETTRFDIVATIPKDATREQVRLMWQNLLSERFQLKLHREDREGAVYTLVVAKGGSKMKESAEASPSIAPPLEFKPQKDEDGFPVSRERPGLSQAANGPRIRLRARQETMAQFVVWLGSYLGHPLADATNLTGKYDFILTYAMPGSIAPEADATPDITSAVSQIGLKLEQKKAPIDTLVIDRLEKVPTGN